MKYWHQFLKPGGYVAVSEACWFTEKRPQEIEDFWMDAYAGIDVVSNKVEQKKRAGYEVLAHFNIPEEDWIEHFYVPLDHAEKVFLEKHKGNQAAIDFAANQRHEINLYHQYKEFYGYTFFVGRKK